MKVMAITGGTGFVGTELIKLAVGAGWQVRALARMPQAEMAGVTWMPGALGRPESLAALVQGADVVVHVGGLVKAPDRATFATANIHGTQAIITATQKAGIRRFIHVSSLTAREPDVSSYGWSKAESERAVSASGLDWTIVRPPAVYGPRDAEMLDLFRMAKWGFVVTPPAGRASYIDVSDLAQLLLALASAPETIGQIYEPDDGIAGGWSHTSYALAIGMALGKQVKAISVSRGLLHFASKLEKVLRRDRAKLTADRVGYLCHPDWVCNPARKPPEHVWRPMVITRTGLKQTVNAYRKAGWL